MDSIKKLELQLFADGGGDGGAAGDAAGTAAAAGNGEAAKGGGQGEDLSRVVYGKQEQAPEPAQETAPQPQTEQPKPEKPKSFDQALKDNPEYAKEMQRRIDQAINRRFAKVKASEEQNARLMTALNLVAGKYGVAAGDTDALIEAINGDTDLIEQQAMDAGMEPDAYREYTRLKAENEAFKKAAAERERQAKMDEAYKNWTRQAEEAKRFFPGLDLRQEVRNDQFAELLGAGIDVLTAYKVVHEEEIQRGLIQRAAADAQRETIAGIAAKQGRPRENGASKPKAGAVKSDISKLTTKDFDEIMRRAQRGERIHF